MRISIEQKATIRQLRAEGLTYQEIQTKVGRPVPKSTLSYICKNIALPPYYDEERKQRNIEHLNVIRPLAVRRNSEKRMSFLRQLRCQNVSTVNKLDVNALKVALAMLYLGEGSKWQGYRGMSLGSAHPKIVVLYIRLLQVCYGVPIHKLKVRVQYRADQDIESLEQYWSAITNIPRSQFYKTSCDVRTIGKPTKKRDYKGVCVIMCSGTEMQLELAAIADLLSEKLGH